MMSGIHAFRASKHMVLAHRKISQGNRKGKVLTVSRLPDDTDRSKYEIENSYRMAPEAAHVFQSDRIEPILRSVLQEELKNVTDYDTLVVAKITTELGSLIKEKVKSVGFPRYKVVCHVVVGERKSQDVRVTSHCLCDPKVDGCARASFQNDVIFAVATVHGLYFE